MIPGAHDFVGALLDPGAARPVRLSDGRGQPAGRRFDVYRNNVAVSLTEALESGFPVVRKLLGEENFRNISGVYLRQHPPRSPVMTMFGDDFAEFLAQFPPLSHLGYLPDMARLDYGLRQSYHAADAVPLDPARLRDLAPDAFGRARLTLAPAVRLLRSAWPVHAIWSYNTSPDAPKPTAGAQDILITRAEFDPVPRRLPTGGADFIAGVQTGMTLDDAHALAVRKAGRCDLDALLPLLLQDRCLTRIEVSPC